ncbi:MAG TPA: sigma-54 dependent transcriptional regulator [Planctomycetota bacterium]|nr:sigma-54 dependent transcriptional regulator [Planctomycetota bacterium]
MPTVMSAEAPAVVVPQPDLLRILVIDDDRALTARMALDLKGLGCQVNVASTLDVAIAYLRDQAYDLAFCDVRLDEHDGLTLLPRLIAANPNLHIVVMTAFASFETAVQAMKAGAADYLPKPFQQNQVRELLAQVRERRRVALKLCEYERDGAKAPVDLGSSSPAMRAAIETITRAAQADIPVLLRGENGTGKSMFAQALHRGSARHSGPFVTVNCPSLSDELMTSELFGHVKGSFTGAIADQKGKVEVAEGGTLFLDELGDLTPAVQAKLLRFLQEQRYERLGDTRTRQADVRIVAATNRDLEAMVAEGRFRQDLLYRLNVVEITLPPLRERHENIIPLASTLLIGFAAAANVQAHELSSASRDLLLAYPWPGNVRELRNELQRITVLWPSRTIEPEAFSPRVRGQRDTAPVMGGDFTLEAIEAEHIRKVLARTDTFENAAKVLGIEPSTLWRKRQRLGL